MRGILDDLEAMTAREIQHRDHVAGEAAEVNRHDGLAAWRQTARGMFEIDCAGLLIDVDENDFRAEIAYHRGGSCECQRRHQHFVTRADSAGLRRQMQPCSC
jgi:hypothetical protein